MDGFSHQGRPLRAWGDRARGRRLLAAPALIVIFFALATRALAHGGGIDANGGHTDHKTGLYHCHRAGCIEKAGASPRADTGKAHPDLAQVAPPSPRDEGYDRADWPHWIDVDGDCQNTRAEVLIEASSEPVKFKRNKPCNVTWGRFFDPYTGKTFLKASDLDVDHIVPLAHAHEAGAAQWTRERKRDFANDPQNLIAVSRSENRKKGADTPIEYLPPRQAYRCEYLWRWLSVKIKYQLRLDLRVVQMYQDECYRAE